MDRIILSDQSVNSYGFRVLTGGADLSAFQQNPVLFFNHRTFEAPAGKWQDLQINGEQISAEPVFDLDDPEAAQLAGKYERGFLNASSIGLRVLETSEDPTLMQPGQIYPTVTKWKLMEASIVSIPANANAVRLYDGEGKEFNLQDP